MVLVLLMSATGRAQDAGQGAPAQATPDQSPPDLDERQIRDWTLRCAIPPGGSAERCEMVQQVLGSEGNTVMVVAVGKIDGANDPGMLVLVPLGISLTAGVKLEIDAGPEVDLDVERCERPGCRIEHLLEPPLLNRLKAGTEAKIAFLLIDPDGQYRPVSVSFSLLGFTAAINEVMS